MKKKLLFIWICLFLASCGNTKNVVENKNIETVNTQEKKVVKEKIIKPSQWDNGLIESAVKTKDISYCEKVKSISKKDCEYIYNQEFENLSKLKCDKLRYFKTECEDSLYLKNKECDKIKDRAKKVNCKYLVDVEKALKNGNKSFCNKLPFSLKKDCQKKFESTWQ